ncbi:MAG: histidine kinase N-terminal 7TM domain-containing protein [Haloferacaceae archaeon]
MVPSGGSIAFVAYALAYALAVVGCAAGLYRARRIEDAATRRGLVGLLAGSAGWAASELGFLLAPTPLAQYAAYTFSLIVGLTTVGAWLYFCSAYTGRSFHADPRYRRLAVAVYAAIVAVKLTNPIHGLYFTTAVVSVPFPHLTIRHGAAHWVVAGLSYALVAVGFFMLYELFLEADYDTRPLAALVAVTGLPVVFDVIGFASARLLDFNYEPLGVAVFAVGVLYVFEDRFLAVQLTDGVDDPVVYLDDEDRIREYNGDARRLFPGLSGAVGEPLAEALPEVADRLGTDDPVLELTRDGERRYVLLSQTAFSLGQADIGRLIVATDVTATERRRRELSRQNEQFGDLAVAIRHELLNTLQVIDGWVDAAGTALDDGEVGSARDSLRRVSRAADGMADTVESLAHVAEWGQSVEGTEPVAFEETAEAAWERVETGSVSLRVEGDGAVEADPGRLRALFQRAFEFAADNADATVRVTLDDDAFAVADDGDPPGEGDTEAFFAYGTAVPDADAGLSLAALRTLAGIHGWETDVDREYRAGTRIVVSGVRVVRRPARPP